MRRHWSIVLLFVVGAWALAVAIFSGDWVFWLLAGLDLGVAVAMVAVELADRRKPEPTPTTPRPDPAVTLMLTAESLAPLYDFAEGQRAELERRGFSPTAAEMVVASWLANGGHS